MVDGGRRVVFAVGAMVVALVGGSLGSRVSKDRVNITVIYVKGKYI